MEITEAAGSSVLVVTHPSAVTWLTGYASDIETGPSPFALPALAIMRGDGRPLLVVSEDEQDAATAAGCDVAVYPGFGIGPVDPVAAAAHVLADLLTGERVAIDAGTFPAVLVRGLDWVDVGNELGWARAVKDPDELSSIRAAIAICDAGQRAAREHAAAGVSELELWTSIRGAMESAAEARLPVLADLVSGRRTLDVGGPPGPHVLAEGDLVLCDLVPRVAGYWGDSCATFAIGGADAPAHQAHARVSAVLADVVAAVRPGAVAGDLDALARTELDFPHHTGHGLGTGWHEEPRIIPGSETVLEEGMVVAIEPGTYLGAGVRLEQVALVTADGCEILSGHDLAL